MSESENLFARARAVIPGGVNSPVRAFGAVGGTPRVIARACGARLFDVDGAELLDYVMSYGAIILGHADPRIVETVRNAVALGSSYGAPTEAEVLLAERIAGLVPGIEKVRMVSSGTEAVMSAVRLARAVTGRPKIVKFAGCYHGHSDAMLARAGSGLATLGIPGTPGVTEGATADTIVLPYNDQGAADAAFAEMGEQIAGVIIEPLAANMGVVPADLGFLQALRARCSGAGALLIFDEVITGFRLGLGGAQQRYGITPDLTCLGKIIGGGLPVGAFGGPARVMDQLAPDGPVYQAGTLSGNPLAMAAGLAVLDALVADPPYERLERTATLLCEAIAEASIGAGVPVTVNREGSVFSAFFLGEPVTDYDVAGRQDAAAYARFFHAMLARGINLAPGAFEAWFVSAAHTPADIDRTAVAIEEAILESRG
ncbi:MAG: glutamate-1-semialdehyde 2,1-aminomutase [Actinomycetota bacterium]